MADIRATPPGVFAPRVLRRLLLIFLPAVLLTGGVVLALYLLDLSNEHALYEQAATSRIDLQSDIIRRELKSIESDLLYLANQAVLRGFLGSRPGTRKELEAEYVLFCRQRGVYDQVRYLDAAGREQVRINFNDGRPAAVPGKELQPKAGRYYFTRAVLLGRGQVFVSPFDLNIEHDQIERPLKPMIRFATPVFDQGGAKRGILVLNYLGAALIEKLSRAAVGFPGAVWLLNRHGYFLRGPSRQDEWAFMLGRDRTFATYFPEEWPRLATGPRGRFLTSSGLFVFQTLPLRADVPTVPAVDAPPTGGSDPGLIVVAHMPPRTLNARADLLLGRLLVLSAVVLIVVFALAWYLAYIGVLRRDHERDLADSEARLRTLSSRLLTAQEDERRSVSRDLHDELGQVVTSVTLDLQRAAQAEGPGRKDELIGRALHGADCLLDRIHEISGRLRPTLLDDLGLKEAVRSYLGEYEGRTGIVTQAELSFAQADLASPVSENVYRILQEALTNVAKHARVAEVIVRLRVADGQVALSVRDAGIGMDPATLDGKRLGILGMRERAELLNGTFTLEGAPGRGTEVRVTIPLPKG
jgi:signal transduction histidine kinase